MTVIDVLIASHYRGPGLAQSPADDDLIWFLHNRLYLNDEESIWVGRLPETSIIMDACEPAGYNFKATRQFGAYYALVNEQPEDTDNDNWDMKQPLTEIVVLSRLVVPAPLGFEYAARIRTLQDGRKQIIPLPEGERAYASDNREWLTLAEWKVVSELAKTWKSTRASTCERLRSALWYREKLAREQHLDVRWVLLATALESLIGVWVNAPGAQRDLPRRGRQFILGVQKLASTCGLPFTQADATTAWQRRSSLAHGAGWPSGSLKNGEPSDDLHVRLESVLNASIRRLIEDQPLRSQFDNDNSLRSWLGY